MNTITITKPKTHVILLKTGEVHYVTEDTVNGVADMYNNDMVPLYEDDGRFKTSFKKAEIGNMMSVESFKMKKNPYQDLMPAVKTLTQGFSADRRKSGIENMIVGLRRTAPNSPLLAKMQLTLNQIQ